MGIFQPWSPSCEDWRWTSWNFAGSYSCVIWRLFKLTWQVNLTSYNLSSESKRGERAKWQVNLPSQLVKLTSLSRGTCHRKWDLSSTKKMTLAKKNRESLAHRRKCLRDFSVPFLRAHICLKAVISDGRHVKYNLDITPHAHIFHSTNSHRVTQVCRYAENGNKKREREWKIQSSTSPNVSVKLLIMSSIYVPGIHDILTRQKSAKFQLRLTKQCPLSELFSRV